jgi:hypothetical protein
MGRGIGVKYSAGRDMASGWSGGVVEWWSGGVVEGGVVEGGGWRVEGGGWRVEWWGNGALRRSGCREKFRTYAGAAGNGRKFNYSFFPP